MLSAILSFLGGLAGTVNKWLAARQQSVDQKSGADALRVGDDLAAMAAAEKVEQGDSPDGSGLRGDLLRDARPDGPGAS